MFKSRFLLAASVARAAAVNASAAKAPGVAQIDTAIREPNQVKAAIQLSVLAP